MTTIRAKQIYTGTKVITDGILTFEEKKIRSVSKTQEGKPDLVCEVITPAFIDPHCHIGMMRAGEPRDEAETNDQMESIIAHADALDSIQMDDTSFRDSIEALYHHHMCQSFFAEARGLFQVAAMMGYSA